jgi:hypothetical protein
MTSEPAPRLGWVAGVVLTVRSLTEAALLGGLALAGSQFGSGVKTAVAGAVLLPLAAAAVRGLFITPRALRRLPDPGRFLVESALVAVAGVALALAGWVVAGVVPAVACIGAAALTRVLAKDG